MALSIAFGAMPWVLLLLWHCCCRKRGCCLALRWWESWDGKLSPGHHIRAFFGVWSKQYVSWFMDGFLCWLSWVVDQVNGDLCGHYKYTSIYLICFAKCKTLMESKLGGRITASTPRSHPWMRALFFFASTRTNGFVREWMAFTLIAYTLIATNGYVCEHTHAFPSNARAHWATCTYSDSLTCTYALSRSLRSGRRNGRAWYLCYASEPYCYTCVFFCVI